MFTQVDCIITKVKLRKIGGGQLRLLPAQKKVIKDKLQKLKSGAIYYSDDRGSEDESEDQSDEEEVDDDEETEEKDEEEDTNKKKTRRSTKGNLFEFTNVAHSLFEMAFSHHFFFRIELTVFSLKAKSKFNTKIKLHFNLFVTSN